MSSTLTTQEEIAKLQSERNLSPTMALVVYLLHHPEERLTPQNSTINNTNERD